MALTEEISKGIIESGLDSIEFSLDGLSASESAYVRVKSRPELTIKNVMRLIELKKEMNSESPKIFISTTQFVRKSELDNIPDSAKAPLWLQDVFSDFVEYKPTFAVKWPHMGDSGKFELHQINDLDKGYCDHVVNTITVRADGSVVACCYDLTSKLVMGNINFDLLENIWNNSNYDNLRTSIKEKSYISICNTCSTVRPVTYLIPKWETNSLQ